MIKLNPYFNFMGQTEEAFNFYRSVFGGDFGDVERFSDVPNLPEKEKMSKDDLNKIMHISLKVGNETLMGTDAIKSLGHTLIVGNNINLSLNIDSKSEADRLFASLSAGGKIEMPMMDMFWEDYFGMVEDHYGIKWMIYYNNKK